jgi:uncharacterized membrane protein
VSSKTPDDSAQKKMDTWPRSLQQSHEAVHSFRAAFNKRRTKTQQLIDRISAFSGSVAFLILNALIFAIWILYNVRILHVKPFDPFPFVLLTTIVSLEAIILSIFVLISQNHQSTLAELREEIDLQVNLISEREITKILRLVAGLYQHLEIKVDEDSELSKMLKPTDPNKIAKILEHQIESEQ